MKRGEEKEKEMVNKNQKNQEMKRIKKWINSPMRLKSKRKEELEYECSLLYCSKFSVWVMNLQGKKATKIEE